MEIPSPVSKKARKVAAVVLPMIFADNDASYLKTCVDMDLRGEKIICLSQTERDVNDPAVKHRDAVLVIESATKWDSFLLQQTIPTETESNQTAGVLHRNWGKFLVQQNFSLIATQTIVCVEAFKELEEDFSEYLKSMGGMPENLPVMESLEPFVKKISGKLKVSVVFPKWYMQLPFGVFAEVIRKILKFKSSNDDEMKNKSIMVSKIRPIFLDIIKTGIENLEEDSHEVDDRMKEALDFMKMESKFEEVVCEWASIGKMRADRNDFSHPFSRAPKEKRQLALELFEMTLCDKFSDKFRHVGLLGLMKVKAIVAKKKREKAKDIEDYNAMFQGVRFE